ncbi:MAG: hypothetical protein QOE28_1645 [Solirubrobacteraceae bacterium]|jgi:hypothetical protein|nr:hypothetical protein [Solirubrobacteraceae bacterium]
MSDIRSTMLSALLSALGEQLAARGAHFHIVVIGGSGLLALGLGDRATQDVDVVAFVENGGLVTARFTDALAESASRVARDFGLQDRWLNPGPIPLLDVGDGLPAGFAERMETVEYGRGLTASFASRYDQIHLKLYAFASRQEPRDEADLVRLRPTADELHAAAQWARTHDMPGPFDGDLADALRVFGVTDARRDA